MEKQKKQKIALTISYNFKNIDMTFQRLCKFKISFDNKKSKIQNGKFKNRRNSFKKSYAVFNQSNLFNKKTTTIVLLMTL